jgi:hypothetical protein
MEGVLTRRGVMLVDDDVRNKFKHKYNTFINKFIIRTKQRVGFDKVIKLYKYEFIEVGKHNVKMLFIPRADAFKLLDLGIISDITTKFEPGRLFYPIESIELFDNQKLIIDYVMGHQFCDANLVDGCATAVANVKAGLGKTFIVGGFIERLHVSTLYLVPRKNLQRQVVKDLTACMTNTVIVKCEGRHRAEIYADYADVIVMVSNSALAIANECNDPESIYYRFFEKFGFIVYDEVHTFCSGKTSKLFWEAQAKYTLALSATTAERIDKFDPVFTKHLGDVLHVNKLPGWTEDDTEFKCDVKMIKYIGPERYTKVILGGTGMLFTPEMLRQIAEDPDRNKLCVDQVIELLKDPVRYIFGFCEHRDHIDVLHMMLAERLKNMGMADGVLFAPELFIMRGGVKDSEINEHAAKARVILTTFSYSGTGVSFVQMNAAVYFTPRRNGYKQIVPRIMRRGSDIAITRIIVDIVDWNTGMRSQYYTRAGVYKFYKAKILPWLVVLGKDAEADVEADVDSDPESSEDPEAASDDE